MPDHSTQFRSDDVLMRATAAWRRSESVRGEAPRLSVEARARILRETFEATGEVAGDSVAAGIRGWFRMGLAWSAPLLLAAVLVVPSVLRSPVDAEPSGPVDVRVAKVDGKVVFTIRNGGRPHTVAKSSDPLRFDPAAAVAVHDGSFEDAATGGPSLVFYKID